jgi:lipoic acid synthetase
MPVDQADIWFSRHPAWLRVRFPGGENFQSLKKLVHTNALHTVCESANCPNIGECWDKGTATFMILGNTCTRRCGFCAVHTGRPEGYDRDEPLRVAELFRASLKHAVVTSVDRDDHRTRAPKFAETICRIRELNPGTNVEVDSGFQSAGRTWPVISAARRVSPQSRHGSPLYAR